MSEEETQGEAPSGLEPYRIVIGVDFEATGDDALREAIRISREHPNDELHAVHVVRVRDSRDAEEIDRAADAMSDAGNRLRERVAVIASELFPSDDWEQPTVLHVRIGDPAECLHQVAVDHDAHMVVVGTHGRRGVEKLILGSVAEKLMKTAHLPVLIARPRNFTGLAKSSRPDEARPGEELSDQGYHRSEVMRIGGRGGHVSGLI